MLTLGNVANLLDLTGQTLDISVRRGTDATIRLDIRGATSLAGYTAHVEAGERGAERVAFEATIDSLAIIFAITKAQTVTLPAATRWIAWLSDDVTFEQTVLVQGRLSVLEFGP